MAKQTTKNPASTTIEKTAHDRQALIAKALVVADDGFLDVDENAVEQFDEIAGGYDGPTWAPHLSDDYSPYSAKLTKEALAKISQPITRDRLCGRLSIDDAFGERRYFLNAKRNGADIAVLLPAHKGIYNRLDKCNLDAIVQVKCDGRYESGRNGKQAAFIYVVHQLSDRLPIPTDRERLADTIGDRDNDIDSDKTPPQAGKADDDMGGF